MRAPEKESLSPFALRAAKQRMRGFPEVSSPHPPVDKPGDRAASGSEVMKLLSIDGAAQGPAMHPRRNSAT